MFAICIIVLSVVSLVTSVTVIYLNVKRIRSMADYTCQVGVKRYGSDIKEINSLDLVPGDLIKIPEQTVLPCDLILLSGSCIVNESMLTGESVPVFKNSIPFTNQKFNISEDAKYVLFGGTKVI